MSKRNYGIDLLRIVSMFMVVMLHQLRQSNAFFDSSHTALFSSYSLLKMFCFGAVNIFALISGYAAYRETPRKLKPSSLISLWAQAVFYGIVFFIIFKIAMPNTFGWSEIVSHAIPNYWYLTAYTGLFFLIPIIDAGVRALEKPLLLRITICLILIFSIVGSFTDFDFQLNNGYSVIWLITLYFIGAVMKKCDLFKNTKTIVLLLIYIIPLIITWLFRIFTWELPLKIATVSYYNIESYSSPTILISSMTLVALFSRLKLSSAITKIITFATPCVFSIYLINCHQLIWDYILPWQKEYLDKWSLPLLITTSIAFSLAFVVISILIDRIRLWLFKTTRLDKLMCIFDKYF